MRNPINLGHIIPSNFVLWLLFHILLITSVCWFKRLCTRYGLMQKKSSAVILVRRHDGIAPGLTAVERDKIAPFHIFQFTFSPLGLSVCGSAILAILWRQSHFFTLPRLFLVRFCKLRLSLVRWSVRLSLVFFPSPPWSDVSSVAALALL